MSFPAYQGALFYFDIPVGHAWRHEFAVIDRNTGQPGVFGPGWVASCIFRDTNGTQIATLNNAGTGDGTVTLAPGMVALDLPAEFTAEMSPTTAYRPLPAKPFAYADLSLTDPDQPGQPYVFARGKGVIYLPTTVTP